MKRFSVLILLLVSFAGYAQNTINNYKYVLVPERFGFSKEPDQYGLNTQSLALLGKKGFTAYSDNGNLPQEIAGNRCQALTADVVQKKGMFVTNLTLLLKDCQGNIVFKGKEGKSWEKEYVVAFNQALAEAFKSLDETPYSYVGPSGTPAPQTVAATTQAATASVQAAPAAAQPAAAMVAAGAPAATAAASTPAAANAGSVLYAQATATGFQLIDTSPKIVLTLLKTSQPDLFIADGNGAHGIVLKTGGNWYFESYKEGQYTKEPLQIKF
ncbi:hypothetical protein DCC81_16330 [Chitinophaga parva]|uniref:Uncharacterized protein n=1 Tax=Chitinophaga parva TaxID=2169414 RepID=A0A2T7BHU9_9BACT|nr:hypothetical protein [Chitinophaga parva]PUZ25823.1 hypothetical protein DCC81_16330 [Chitinophaga parva]